MYGSFYVKHYPLTFIAETAGSTVTLTKSSKVTDIPRLQYRTDERADWEDYEIDQTITLTNVNDYVQFQNLDTYLSGPNTGKYFQFVITGLVYGRGNLQSMLNYINTIPQGGFCNLFKDCTGLLSTPKMPGIIVDGLGQYWYTYSGCSNLIESEDLPSKSLNKYAYYNMYSNCISLRQPPTIAATTVGQYSMVRYVSTLFWINFC